MLAYSRWGTRTRSTESISGASQCYRRPSVSLTAYATSVWWSTADQRCLITSLRSVGLAITSFVSCDRWPEHSLKTLVQAFMSCRLDYCNALLYSITDNLFRRLQSIQKRRRDFWRAPGDVTTSHQFCHICTGCQWSNGSSSNWLYWSSSRCGRNPFVPRGWLRADRWLRTPSSALGRRQRSHCSAKLTLGSETGVFRCRDRKYGTVFPPHCKNRTLNMCSSNDF